MYTINQKGFSYLLYPKKHTSRDVEGVFKNQVEMLYYYLNRGVPISDDMPDPIYCTQEMVNQYGLDNLVMNMQRKYKYDYDIIVVKVPQEYLNMNSLLGDPVFSKENAKVNAPKIVPMSCRYEFLGEKRDMIACDYIESVYLRYPDCRRVLNDNWRIVSDDHFGMKNLPIQNKMLEMYRKNPYNGIMRSDNHDLDSDEKKSKFMEDNDLNSRQLCDMCRKDLKLKVDLGYRSATLTYIRDKYKTDEKIYKCQMTKSRIANILAVETERQSKIDRCRFVGE